MKFKTKLGIATALAVACSAVFYGGVRYGRSHRSLREKMEYIWDNGQGFARGWSECEQSYGIQWVNDSNGFQGWLCTRYHTNMPPGFHEMVIARSKFKP